MKLTSTTVALALIFAGLTEAVPFGFGSRGRFQPSSRQRGNNNNANNNNNNNQQAARGRVAGAVYFLTNEPSGNFVVASQIGSDGKLSSPTATSAQGRGGHGAPDTAGPDGLFSQGSVKAGGGNLFAVNTGSNTVAMFSINKQNPTNLKMVGFPVSSGGEFPVSLAVSTQSGNVCALNGGEINGVACFKPDAKLGLVPIAGSNRDLGINQTSPANGPAGTVSHVLFSEDGKQLIASVKGVPPNPGFLAVWDVAADGSLSDDFKAVTAPKGGLLPFGMATLPGTTAVVATDAGVGFDVIDLPAALTGANSGSTAIQSLAAGNAVAAGKSASFVVGGQKAVCWAAFSKKTKTFFMTDIGTAQVTEVSVDPTSLNATIVKQYQLGAGSATIDDAVATIGNNDFLYVLAANASTVDVMSLTAPGQAKLIQSLNFAQPMRQASITISASNLQGMAAIAV